MTHTFSKIALVLVASVLLSACASTEPPTLGDTIKAQGAEYSKIGDNWSKGDIMIKEGLALQESGAKNAKKGQKLVKKGEASIKDGQSMVKKGTALKQQAEAAFEKKKG